jgi:hypothetical protein
LLKPDTNTRQRPYALQALTIKLLFQPVDVYDILHGKNFQRDWAPLADLLSDNEWFPDLQNVKVALSVNCANREGWVVPPLGSDPGPSVSSKWDGIAKECEERMLGALVSLEGRGILSLVFHSESAKSFV